MRGGEASAEMRNNMSLCVFFSVRGCVRVAVCAFPRRGAGGNVRYEIRMQYKERDGFKLNYIHITRQLPLPGYN